MTSKIAEATMEESKDLEEGSIASSSFHDDDDYDVTSNPGDNSEESRDEVKEVEKATSSDTHRLRLWRIVVTVVLLLTALAVTLTTYQLLRREQKQSFETAYDQFSRSVADAAVVQRRAIVDSLHAYASSVSLAAESTNQTWPFVRIPFFEEYGANFLRMSNSEISSFIPIVDFEDVDAYPEFVGTFYEELIKESHMLTYGSLDNLIEEDYKDFISGVSPDGLVKDKERETYFPIQVNTPPPRNYRNVNWNLGSVPHFGAVMESVRRLKTETLTTKSTTYTTAVGAILSKEGHDAMHDPLPEGEKEHPHTFYFYPIHRRIADPDSDVVGIVTGAVALDRSSRNLLPDGVDGIVVVVRNSCGQEFTYELQGRDAIYLGSVDRHEEKYSDFEVVVDMTLHDNPEAYTAPGHCLYTLSIYPSTKFEQAYDTNTPEVYAAIVAVTFVCVAIVFYVYDLLVQRRNEKIVINAAKSNAIVTQLFPGKMRDQVIEQNAGTIGAARGKANLRSFVAGQSDGMSTDKPLAELYLETTILIADISGFTSWSSVREPSQVFTLLETVYKHFDEVAHRRRVFKVETVGDCYVAATGIPEPRRDHTAVMVRFGHDIISVMARVVKTLELSLGPDTSDLALRVGVHTGPVTAGVLRGERARFQLFGDTMNTCSRIESTGIRNRVHLSKEAADEVRKSGKEHWLEPREGKVSAKGKGVMETYLVKKHLTRNSKSVGSSDAGLPSAWDAAGDTTERTERLISWNVETLLGLLKQVVARREALAAAGRPVVTISNAQITQIMSEVKQETFLEEVKEIITLPDYDSTIAKFQRDPGQVELPEKVVEQLRSYVETLASMYRNNSFHCFEHASHVLQSVTKLMSRIVAPSDWSTDSHDALHDHTYGITSDPLTQFSCALSALIHDVDHVGVPNSQLIKENATVCRRYKNRSPAEQNSLQLSWDLLMDPKFEALRSTICSSKDEVIRFRQLVVNSVMATDIVDKGLKELRNGRWDKAFKDSTSMASDNEKNSVNRKATIVIEHLIQASDVSHTMQHWNVYRKWNENFFFECYGAYKAGRAESDPSVNWYKGEIGFFDFYIIPLAKKLKECGVFGVSSGEYLDYAQKNREEWVLRGEEVVAEMLQKFNDDGIDC
ncbi:Receptor-type guanylate cyclase gcy [Seminavis robusta]|uniref:Receptor-type guanylate cyclase gcy n=1 Tax=Seminavis robusta TaxID=568900 RepID=A0A9N8DC25_9STRA|nr:Receptor-type guanylate cyclase gcy [Seminavis robusta]|eukprot:Sro29_g019290.1 Receptor-type guanylate cyclase gcy (1132) ;mRNA; f:138027-142390